MKDKDCLALLDIIRVLNDKVNFLTQRPSLVTFVSIKIFTISSEIRFFFHRTTVFIC